MAPKAGGGLKQPFFSSELASANVPRAGRRRGETLSFHPFGPMVLKTPALRSIHEGRRRLSVLGHRLLTSLFIVREYR